jgi:hypothetical protein
LAIRDRASRPLLDKWLFRLRRRACLTARAAWRELSDQGGEGVIVEVAFVSEFAFRYPHLDLADQSFALART